MSKGHGAGGDHHQDTEYLLHIGVVHPHIGLTLQHGDAIDAFEAKQPAWL